jgi:hypothetical protein
VSDPDAGQWVTYAQAGRLLGISPEAVRAIARRRGWARQTPNEIGGLARVLLPTGADRRSRPGSTGGVTGADRVLLDGRPTGDLLGDHPGDRAGDRAGELAVEVSVLRERIADQAEVIADLRHRLNTADRRLDEAAEDRRRIDALQAALTDAQGALAIATNEAAALRAQADARRSHGLLRRLREALRRT